MFTFNSQCAHHHCASLNCTWYHRYLVRFHPTQLSKLSCFCNLIINYKLQCSFFATGFWCPHPSPHNTLLILPVCSAPAFDCLCKWRSIVNSQRLLYNTLRSACTWSYFSLWLTLIPVCFSNAIARGISCSYFCAALSIRSNSPKSFAPLTIQLLT